jgi:hypothetical protein
MIDTKHSPEPWDDDAEHNVICSVCCRLGKVVTVEMNGVQILVQLWYAGDARGNWDGFSASKVCEGNATWLDDTIAGT